MNFERKLSSTTRPPGRFMKHNRHWPGIPRTLKGGEAERQRRAQPSKPNCHPSYRKCEHGHAKHLSAFQGTCHSSTVRVRSQPNSTPNRGKCWLSASCLIQVHRLFRRLRTGLATRVHILTQLDFFLVGQVPCPSYRRGSRREGFTTSAAPR